MPIKLTRPEAMLSYVDPAGDGIPDLRGYGKDWPLDKRWNGLGTEFIEPLVCAGPTGDMRPSGMEAWTVGDTRLRPVWGPGNPAAMWMEFTDGNVYANGTALATYAAAAVSPTNTNQPNLTLRMDRYAPPPRQGVTPQTILTLWASLQISTVDSIDYLDPDAGTWTYGQVALCFPFLSGGAAKDKAYLVWSKGRTGGTLNMANLLSDHATGAAQQGGSPSEMWSLETVIDAARFPGTHILIREAANPTEWWHTYNPAVRLVPGPYKLLMGGCRQQVNCSPIAYAGTADEVTRYAFPREPQKLPGASWNPTATWGALSTAATGWTVAATIHDDTLTLGQRPRVTFLPDGVQRFTRPIVWLATEEHAPTLATPEVILSEDTDGNANLASLTMAFGRDWKGSRGNAQFHAADAAIYNAWRERGKVTVNLGWQDDAGTTGYVHHDLHTLYIMPEGINRERDGSQDMGRPQFSLDLGDFGEAKLDSEVVDMRQAGGQLFADWAETVRLRLGLATVTIAAALSGLTIPTAEIPSKPRLDPADGSSWRSHIEEVCKSLGIRYGWSLAGLFFDGGPPAYVAGTSPIAFVVDSTSILKETFITRAAVKRTGPYRNALKAQFGPEGARRAEYFLSDSTVIESDGGDLWGYVDQQDGETFAHMLAEWSKDHHREQEIDFDTFLQPYLRPDHFVQIGSLSDVGAVTGQVYQVRECSVNLPGDMNATSSVTAELVYTPPS